ncbi:MAG: HNH endonuclease signature motif containing protein [Candidatus Pacearchaeota archaeon]|nr:HNH endonuclease signature motif containing protein [Candidatus Pacearchaeota archaeon]
MNAEKIQKIIEQFVDLLMPELTPYETSLYIFFLRNSFLSDDMTIRIGKRTIGFRLGGAKGRGGSSKATSTSFAHVTEIINGLGEKGCIKIGDTNRDGTLYHIILPSDIPLVAEKLAIVPKTEDEDYFTKPEKRKELFERDKWVCHYCGEKVTEENATLDHLTPQHKGGKHTKDNLKTSCLVCNGIKSGKTYGEAAPFLLKSVQERKARSHK